MTTEVKDVVARLRECAKSQKVFAGVSDRGAVYRTDKPKNAALFKEAASLLESLSSQVTEADRIAGNNAALWRVACSMVDERNVQLTAAESRATAAEGRVALLEEALGRAEKVLRTGYYDEMPAAADDALLALTAEPAP